ncbi:MAG TPA: DDE-type integrase/transposase/recombinase, partial [Bosea sp. (in: a-proteobacteria)]
MAFLEAWAGRALAADHKSRSLLQPDPNTDALIMAIWRRGKPDALLHHSDQGSQYTSQHFQELLAENGVTCSMSRSSNVWDNAAMESFFSSLKTERIRDKRYLTRDAA